MLRRTQSRKPNSNAGSHGRPNGHGPDSVPACDAGLVPASYAPAPARQRGGVPVSACPCPAGRHHDRAASDDASGTSVACAPASAVAGLHSQASTDREAYAAAAPPLLQSLSHEAQEKGKPQSAASHAPLPTEAEGEQIPGGELPLPSAPSDFVDEVHRDTNLFDVWRSLLQSKDEKVRQRAVEKLTEMRYKGAAALADEPQRIIIDMPGPTRD